MTCSLHNLISIVHDPAATFSRGGYYHPTKNIWVPETLAEMVAGEPPEYQPLLEVLADVALAAGQLHRRQIDDAHNGRLWPQAWIERRDGAALRAALQAVPAVGSHYTVVQLDAEGRVHTQPFSRYYADLLKPLRRALSRVERAGPAATPLRPYLQALQRAMTPGEREDDAPLFLEANRAWVKIPFDAPYLLLAEFTEVYSDPLARLIAGDPETVTWLDERQLDPWKCFFEFRVLKRSEGISREQVLAIRQTNKRLYSPYYAIPDEVLERVSLEWRVALMVAGHGALPPRTAKNYPNADEVRRTEGYKNVIYVNSITGNAPNLCQRLRDNFQTAWAHGPDLEARLIRGRQIDVTAHEETHPWLPVSVQWLEEFKASLLGIWSAYQSGAFSAQDMTFALLSTIAATLDLAVLHWRKRQANEHELEAYYIGDTIFVEFARQAGVLIEDDSGRIVDVQPERFATALPPLVDQVLETVRGLRPPDDLRQKYMDERVWDRFAALVRT